LVVAEPAVAESEQPGKPPPLIRDRPPDLVLELLDRCLQGRELQVLLAAEEAEDAALLHLHLPCEATNGEPVERGAIDRGLGHRGAGLGDCGLRTAGHVLNDIPYARPISERRERRRTR